jgi:hypothetical protein
MRNRSIGRTVTLDPDVVALVTQAVSEGHQPFGRFVNDASGGTCRRQR